MPSSSLGDEPDQADDQRDVRAVNEALIAMSVRQHELIEEANLARRKAEALSAELRASEERLRESERRFRMVADNIAQLAWTCDKLGNVTWYNQRWLDYTGLNHEAMEGWEWSKVQHPDHLDRVVARVKRSAETGEPWEDTFPLRGKDSEYRWFLSRAVPIRDAAGNIIRWFGTNTDITEQRQAEAALKEADHRKNEFLAMLAHELRNPLAPIHNAVQVLRLTGGNGEAVASASAMMERQVGQMVRLVDDLLDLSRISRGKIELRRVRVELASAVHHAVEAARPLVQSMEHDLTVILPPTPIYLHADPTRLAQVIGNLLNNACKFTNKGGHISLTVEQVDSQAIVRVRDPGIGIAADQLPRIFDMFMQIDTSLERSVSGLGLGLTLVKNLVEMHNGTVEVNSDGIGKGTEFVVRLPIMAGATKPSPPEPPTSESSRTTARRILVVDDNRDSAESLAMLLKLTKNDTHTAYDGLEAVEAAATWKPDVILFDIGLPKLNGYEACRRIREQPWGRGMIMVALTGWCQQEDRQRSSEAGFDGHLVKPVDLAALTQLLAGFSDT
jgi:PAS domain S-box-containing protein